MKRAGASMPADPSGWDVAKRVAFLTSVRLFQPPLSVTLAQVARHFVVRQVPRGDFVFLRGAPASRSSRSGDVRNHQHTSACTYEQ